MADHLTGNYRAYGRRAGCVAAPFVALALLMVVAVTFYALPEAAQAAINSGDFLTYFGVIGVAVVVILFFAAPGAAGVATAANAATSADEYDQHTRQDDVSPAGEEKVTDDGVFRRVRGGWVKVRDLSAYERLCRDAENNGGFVGYNEAVNEGRR